MSHAVARGKPTAAQLYLDTILDELLVERGVKPTVTERAKVSLAQLMFHCLKRKPDNKFITNGATGEVFTNEHILKRAVSLARALLAAGLRGRHVLVLVRNHEHAVVVYLATILAGTRPFMMDPNTTAYELSHFLSLVEPSHVFYDREHHTVLTASVQKATVKPVTLVVAEQETLAEFVQDCSDDVANFIVPDPLDESVLLLPTSGSTGLPKAAVLTHSGTVAQVPVPWAYHTTFPTPTSLVLLLTSLQWTTFTMMITACIANHVPLLISPKPNTVENVTELLEKFRPTWTFFTPALASSLIQTVRADQLHSLETLTLLGAPPPPEVMKVLQDKLPKTAQLSDGYGATETHGFIAYTDIGSPFSCNGFVLNTLQYKIVDEEGLELGLNQTGELWVKGPTIKTYHKNAKSYSESFTSDGWFTTGDIFHVGHDERISFVARRKFSFKYKGCQVAPEEVERVILSVPGVVETIVCATERGPAAAVVKLTDSALSEELIHRAVNETLSDHKHLHGGLVFVPSLPHTHSGKLNRGDSTKLILSLITNGTS